MSMEEKRIVFIEKEVIKRKKYQNISERLILCFKDIYNTLFIYVIYNISDTLLPTRIQQYTKKWEKVPFLWMLSLLIVFEDNSNNNKKTINIYNKPPVVSGSYYSRPFVILSPCVN